MIAFRTPVYSGYIVMQPEGKARPRVTRAGHAYTPSKTVQAEHRIQTQVGAEYRGPLQEGPLSVRITAWLQKPKSKPKHRRSWATSKPDADNYAKLVLDALNGIVWRDDAQVVELQIVKDYCEEGSHPGFSIVVDAIREVAA